MIEIDWLKDYQYEFQCPKCEFIGMRLDGHDKKVRRFRCSNCRKSIRQLHFLGKNYFSNILAGYGFACPNSRCHAKQMILQQVNRGKKQFICRLCYTRSLDSTDLTKKNISRYGNKLLQVRQFNFKDETWDLRAISSSFQIRDSYYTIKFDEISCNWFKLYTKKYVLILCKKNKSFSTIQKYLTGFRKFADYLVENNINHITEINRFHITNFINYEETTDETIRTKLRVLKQLFTTGNIQGWFEIDPDIIRDSDYPKWTMKNPDPIPDVVREQIEKNLHKLPDPIARMWIVCFFAAMRPYELALLKKDCLEQVGDKWKLVWWRKKGKKFHQHSVPITTTIAKVVQEQLNYIDGLWGEDWEYLFCHYHNISQSNPNHPRLKPVKKVIPRNGNPLEKAIRTLLKAENILNDNGELAQFQTRLIRETRLTELFLKGHDLSVVSAWAGHRQLATTANFYTQVTCQQIEKEVGHIQSALVNADGKKIYYESMPKSFWDNPVAHELEVAGTHVNTPIYGYCGLDLDEECDKFRACYTCRFFVAKPEKLSQYVEQRDELREKQERAMSEGHSVLVEQFARQADQLDKIILSLQEAA